MYRNFVVMLCGPHEDDHVASPQYHRIEVALRLARRDGSDLLVCGDARNGNDVELFVRYARDGGKKAIPVYDAGGSTLTDVRAALAYVRDHTGGHSSGTVHVVTDDWHMRRAMAMFRGEAPHHWIGDQEYGFEPISVVGGKTPAAWQLQREEQGVEDYRAGRYDFNRSPKWGKPP